MIKVRIISPATFGAGTVLGLAEDQATNRQHVLESVGKGVYRTTGTVQFKVGEEICLEGEIPKAMGAVIGSAKKPRSQAKVQKPDNGAESETDDPEASTDSADPVRPE